MNFALVRCQGYSIVVASVASVAAPVAERVPEPDLPGDRGEVLQLAARLLHHHAAVLHARRRGAVPVLPDKLA